VHVAIDRDRHLQQPPGVRVRRVVGLAAKVQWNLGPPRLRYDELVIDLAVAAPDELAAVAVLADACGTRRTTALRLLDVLGARQRVARRRFLSDVLNDVAAGTCSVLEHGYLTQVERAHGLPVGQRQTERMVHGARALQDVEYVAVGLVVELDGRAAAAVTESISNRRGPPAAPRMTGSAASRHPPGFETAGGRSLTSFGTAPASSTSSHDGARSFVARACAQTSN
jgi:hypothetical protein